MVVILLKTLGRITKKRVISLTYNIYNLDLNSTSIHIIITIVCIVVKN